MIWNPPTKVQILITITAKKILEKLGIQTSSLFTLLFYQIEPFKNGDSLILPSEIHRNRKQKEFLKSCGGDSWDNLSSQIFKHMDRAGRSLRHFLDKVKEWHFNSTSNEVIWPKKFKFHAWIKKCLKTPNMHFLPVFELLSDSLTTI